MKKCIYLLTITFLFVSCGTKSEEAKYIPKHAIGVMYVNVKSLSEKSEGLNFKDLKVNSLMEDKAPKELKDFMDEFMTSENINKTFRKEYILGFMTYKRLTGVGGLILPINDAESFEALIQPMIDKMPSLEKETNVGKDDAFTVYSNRELAIGWNNNTALLIGANNYAGAELKDLTTLDASETVLTTKYFNDFFDKGQDMGVHITSTPLGDAFDGLLSMFAGLDINLEDNNIAYYGSFEDDHIHTETKLKLNKDIMSLSGYKDWMSTDYNRDMLEALPKDALLVGKLSINIENLHEHFYSLRDNKTLPIEAREELRNGLKKMDRDFNKEIGMDTKAFAKIFDGSALFALTEGQTVKDSVYNYNYYTDEEEYKIVETKTPNMFGAIGIKDKAKFDRLFSKIKDQGAPIKEISTNYYEVDRNTFMVITDSFVFFTNHANSADEVKNNGKLATNLSDFKHKDKLSHSIYLYTKENISNVVQDYSNMFNPYGRNNFYRVDDMDEFTEISGKLYDKYFGENHYYIDADGAESFTYTKGDKNSLVQTILYGDELAKAMSDLDN
ncbi:DUF4836 family protein [Olleya aquimaris]|uniref:Uncharacterized protein DUF4836 n=1 Tax=Olleya aquimaris TaxID=639310 RepID=A0A327RBR6_9FLAO|nr:DUF4836 family protein [Olleya aquimaris]RAJ13412.1 uncharacterized protein DUF4836 [Olleya aquimaris]